MWAYYVGDPHLASHLTRRSNHALFMVAVLIDPVLSREAPAIAGRKCPSVQTLQTALAAG
ncbi:hypothetical protein ACEWPM_004695 [Roseovarius sp. S4756]